MSNREPDTGRKRLRRLFGPRMLMKVGVPMLVVIGGWEWYAGSGEETFTGATFEARRGPLIIQVVDGGSVSALEQQEVKSEVEGTTKILSIVEEGYSVTQEDIDNRKVLVELDSKELRERQVAQELEYQNALAAFTEAKEEYQIQVNQNVSDIMASELAVKFARMDFQKYMGATAGDKILDGIKLVEDIDVPLPSSNLELLEWDDEAKNLEGDKQAEDDSKEGVSSDSAEGSKAAEEKPAEKSGDVAAAPTEPPAEPVIDPEALSTAAQVMAQAPRQETGIDFADYANIDKLGDGEAGQRLRKLEDDFVLSKKELGLSKSQFEGTQRLAQREFVTKNDLEVEQLKVEGKEIALKTAETSKELFIKYEFPKMAEKLLSDYLEATRKLKRAQKLAISKLAQSEAKLRSTEARYTLQARKRMEIAEQIAKCVIRAERTGLVVYGGGDDWRGEDRIEEGATIRERQKIITIPDMSRMSVELKVHESAIKKIEKGQKARIRFEVFPDEVLEGEVVKLAVLPDSQNRWMNPDIKVYETVVGIKGVHPWLKPGMTAQVEILVKELPEVVYVPIQAVVPNNGERVCYVSRLGGPQRCAVETGEANDEFIEIRKGISEGDEVLLRAPVLSEEMEDGAVKDTAEPGKPGEEAGNPEGKAKKKGGGQKRPQGKAAEAPAAPKEKT